MNITLIADFLSVLDLLDFIRQGIFDVIHIVPPAATWSRSRHSGILGQRPLRSRLAPLGLPSLTPLENDKVNSANRALEVVLWCAGQALSCKSKAVGLNIIFPEDLGGQQSEGPSSLWVLRNSASGGHSWCSTCRWLSMPVHSNRLQAPVRSFLNFSQTSCTTFTGLATSGSYSRQTCLQRTSTEELCLQSYSYTYDWYFRGRCFLHFRHSYFQRRFLETFCFRPPSGVGAQLP